MNSIEKTNNVSFQGRMMVTSDGFKQALNNLPSGVKGAMKELKRFVQSELPSDCLVIVNGHNAKVVNPNRPVGHPHFTTIAKGEPQDLVLSFRINGSKGVPIELQGDALVTQLEKIKATLKSILKPAKEDLSDITKKSKSPLKPNTRQVTSKSTSGNDLSGVLNANFNTPRPMYDPFCKNNKLEPDLSNKLS